MRSGFDKVCEPAGALGCEVARWIFQCVSPCLLCISIIGNMWNILLFSRKSFRNKPIFLCLFLSIFDLLFTISVLPLQFLRHYEISYVYDQNWIFCRMSLWVGFTSSISSLWTLALITIQRVRALLIRNLGEDACTMKYVVCPLGMAGILAFIIGLFVFDYGNAILHSLVHNNISLFDSLECNVAKDTHDTHISVLRALLYVVTLFPPCAIVVVCLIYRLKQQQRRSTVHSTFDSQTKILFIITGFMFLTVSPFGVFSVLEISQKGGGKLSPTETVTWAIVVNIFWCNYTFNFLCFLFGSKLIKDESRNLIKTMKTEVGKCFSKFT